MSAIIVRVLTDNEFVECVRRLQFPLADGRSAVLYAGYLFPVKYPGPNIEVSGERYCFEQLPGILGSTLISPTIRIYLDCSGSDARLMVDGDALVRDFVFATVGQAGIVAKIAPLPKDPPREGYLADDGNAYDWCIEFAKDDTALELKTHLDLAPMAPRARRGSQAVMSQSETPEGGLSSSNVEITGTGLQLVQKSPEPDEADPCPPPSELCGFLLTRFRELVSLNKPAITGKPERVDPIDIVMWRQKVVNGPQIATELLEELDAANELIKNLQQNKDSVSQERDNLAIRLSKKVSISSVLSQIFPEIEFIQNSDKTIDKYFSSVDSLGRVLRAIVGNDPTARRECIRGSRTRWFEQHVATGSRSNGRIYFADAGPSKFKVLVSFKNDQERDLQFLRSLPSI